MRKRFILLFLLILPLVSASLQIEKTTIVDSIIPEINNHAIFYFNLTNLGETDNFKLYSTVGAGFTPADFFEIKSGETKQLEVKVNLTEPNLQETHIFNFQYKIESSSEIKQDEMLIKVTKLKDAFKINSYNINLDSDNALVYVQSETGYSFDKITADFNSSFFQFSRVFSLDPYEKKEFSIELNKSKVKKLIAGDYALETDLETLGFSQNYTGNFKFTEKAEITTNEKTTGFLIWTHVIEKINGGNIPFLVSIKVKKNIISRLFTNFNIAPSITERKGILVEYTFQREIQPSESLKVSYTTNWFYPLLIILLIVIIVYFVMRLGSSDLTLKKKAGFVRTKGGEFALKINIVVRAKKHIENVKILDRIPHMVKLFEKYGSITPSKISSEKRALEWELGSLQANEERVISYIIYSKIGVIGKFELPKVHAIYEQDSKVKEVSSNKVFFMTETPKSV